MRWFQALLAAGLAACLITLGAPAAEDQKSEPAGTPAFDSGPGTEFFLVRDVPGVDPSIFAGLLPDYELSMIQDADLPALARRLREAPGYGPLARGLRERNLNPELRARQEKRLRTQMIFGLVQRMVQEVDLTEEQTVQILSMMLAQGKKNEDLARQRREVVGNLRSELKKDKPDQKALQNLLAQFKDLGNQRRQAEQAGREKIMALLSPEQQARFVVLGLQVQNRFRSAFARGGRPGMMGGRMRLVQPFRQPRFNQFGPRGESPRW